MREPELLKAFQTAWTGVSNYQTLLPGGLHETVAGRDNTPDAAAKWALITVNESSVARQTNGGPIREHVIQIELKATDGITANASVLHALGTIPTTLNKTLDNGGKVIDCWPHQAPKGGQTTDQRRGRPVSALSIAWRVQSRWDY